MIYQRKYNSNTPNISSKEGMIRLLTYGLEFSNVSFPEIGSMHIATMMNGTMNLQSLIDIMNETGLEQIVPMVGCGDKVGWIDDDGNNTTPLIRYDAEPNFKPSCEAILQWD